MTLLTSASHPKRAFRSGLAAWLLVELVGCGDGGGDSPAPAPPPPAPSLTSIALAPRAMSLAPGESSSLTVTGTYSDGSMQTLPAAGEAFSSSDIATVTVSASGIVTAAAGAADGASATIRAQDTGSGLSTTADASTVVTIVVGGKGPPTPGSVTAVTQTAGNDARCTAIQPFYWEIGNRDAALASGSSTQAGGTPVQADTVFPIASASKWIYGIYVVQQRGGAANLTANDVGFLNFTSGYTYMDSSTSRAVCSAPPSGPDSINHCLTLPSSTPGKTYASHDPDTSGLFYYNPGHQENHAGQLQPEINSLDASQLGAAIVVGTGVNGITLRYNQPLLAGGVIASANDYAAILRAIVGGRLAMRDALGTHAVCAWIGPGCDAVRSPALTVQWHYSISHWIEDDPATGDGAFSSPGAFGFYPWIEANKQYYGVISRFARSGDELQAGLASSRCGQALRAAWETGTP